MKLPVIFLLINFLRVINCETNIDDQKIVGGFQISILDASYQGALLYRNSFICGCSIISPKYLLTAAHCVHEYRNSLTIRVGSSHAYHGGEVYQVEKVIKHPLFSITTLNNDFALLKLKNNITLINGEKEIIKLPRANENIEEGTEVFVSGFGSTNDLTTNDHTLRGVIVPIVSQSECKRAYPKMITNRMICAGFEEGKKDACSGDSGGPMVRDRTLVGVVSFGIGCALPKMYGVYGKVSTVRNWIKAETII
ncbi:hypothetical protein PVAND_004670 [Polypedilum vanderplanki]|uniref:trypsin n=1 Tax=Polypedilum vanderplanki TaxID=319348 RepID=A0A9J6BZS7_POLVA|nr:hypothetical protein PVAND_004670 [Polypedilum vanderplanki]